ncbi:MAG: N-acetylmuramidase family protein [Bacteroidales bacterium]|nr:N-acetylmuramidase family protein [Bacteroidales bacterium]
MKHILSALTIVLATGITVATTEKDKAHSTENVDKITATDTLNYTISADGDTVFLDKRPENRSGRLTEEDFREVAEELGVETAAIKAVVEIEAGKAHQGFWKEDNPLINFDLAMFRRMAQRNKVNLSKYTRSHAVVFARPNISRYGGQQAAQQARLDAARTIHDLSAIEGTFWGMFQIGGFNWKKCGTSSPDEFVQLMSRSERDQLELFAKFITNTGLLKYLKAKNWAAFARGYNGNSYAARGYHTRLANAYARHKKLEKANG